MRPRERASRSSVAAIARVRLVRDARRDVEHDDAVRPLRQERGRAWVCAERRRRARARPQRPPLPLRGAAGAGSAGRRPSADRGLRGGSRWRSSGAFLDALGEPDGVFGVRGGRGTTQSARHRPPATALPPRRPRARRGPPRACDPEPVAWPIRGGDGAPVQAAPRAPGPCHAATGRERRAGLRRALASRLRPRAARPGDRRRSLRRAAPSAPCTAARQRGRRRSTLVARRRPRPRRLAPSSRRRRRRARSRAPRAGGFGGDLGPGHRQDRGS